MQIIYKILGVPKQVDMFARHIAISISSLVTVAKSIFQELGSECRNLMLFSILTQVFELGRCPTKDYH